MLQTFLFSFKQVFSSPKYIILALAVFIFVLSFAIWLPNLNFLRHVVISDTFSSSQKIGIISSLFGSFQTNFTPVSRFITVVLAILFAINLSFFVFYIVRLTRLTREAGIGSTGFIIGLLGIGCASCGSVIISSVLGTAATAGLLGFLPLKGLEFGILSILLLSYSTLILSKKIKDPLVCNAKPISMWSIIRSTQNRIIFVILILFAFFLGVILTRFSI